MIGFKLIKENLIQRNVSNTEIRISIDESEIQKCIDLFNKEIKWDGMFDLTEAKRRIISGDIMFIGYHKNEIFGYCWLKKISERSFLYYNLFSKANPKERNYGATDLLYLIINKHTEGEISSLIDEWNYKSIRVAEKLGFVRMDD
jgi:RimJ/RimL family protein N-acetyltransferase